MYKIKSSTETCATNNTFEETWGLKGAVKCFLVFRAFEVSYHF